MIKVILLKRMREREREREEKSGMLEIFCGKYGKAKSLSDDWHREGTRRFCIDDPFVGLSIFRLYLFS